MAAGPVVRDLGRAEYLPTWRAMREFTAARSGETADELWIVEHPPVFTLGQGGRREHLLDPGEIPVVATDRGGQVTYHGPGQVVVYTLIDLRRLGIFVRELVYRIEQSVIQVLGESGIDAQRVRGAPGVYVRDTGSRAGGELAGFAKIAALGIKVSRGCSYHGVALNVSMDLAPFSRIDPCGYAGLPTVDLATLNVSITWRDAADRLAARLQQHFTA
jgi:lipoyl(octanoyl) transferase